MRLSELPPVAGMSDVEYHSTDTLSSSGARLMLHAPAVFKSNLELGREDTDALRMGRHIHALVLEGRRLYRARSLDGRTKEGKAELEEIGAAGLDAVTVAHAETVEGVAAAIAAAPEIAALFTDGTPELSVFTERGGVELRTRPDWTAMDGTRLVDLKTTRDAAPHKFGRTAHTYGYHLQAAWYLRECAAKGLISDDAEFVFVLVEKTPPYLVSQVVLEPAALELGSRMADRAISLYRHCLETGEWPGFDMGLVVAQLPPWAYELDDF